MKSFRAMASCSDTSRNEMKKKKKKKLVNENDTHTPTPGYNITLSYIILIQLTVNNWPSNYINSTSARPIPKPFLIGLTRKRYR